MHAWNGYIFQYVLGGVVFLLGLWLGTRRRADRVIWVRGRWGYRVLIGGFVMYAAGHALWIVLALRAPFNAPVHSPESPAATVNA